MQVCEQDTLYAAAFRTSVTRMFISLDVANKIVDAVMDEQGYDTPHALSCLDKRGIEQLDSSIQKPGGLKNVTWNPHALLSSTSNAVERSFTKAS